MKIMFMGTPDFSLECLKALIGAGWDVTSVVTTPDKPRGRGHKMCPTPVGEYASENNLRCYKPVNLKKENFENILIDENPDIIIVVAYGKLLGEYILNYPKHGCINVHASLLPRYRGAAPIQRAIIDGEILTGVTTMYMEKGLDTGDMLMKSEVEITSDDNFETLHDKLAASGAELICKTLEAVNQGTLSREEQQDELSCYAHMITKETALINWSDTSSDIYNLVRGLYPVPKAFSFYKDKQLKICLAKVSDETTDAQPGKIIDVCSDRIKIACGKGTVLDVLAIQIEGKRQMPVTEFLKGNIIDVGTILGG